MHRESQLRRISIRNRLGIFFAAVVTLMLLGSLLSVWQFRDLRLYASQVSLVERRVTIMLRLNNHLVTLLSRLHRAADLRDSALFEMEAASLLTTFQERSADLMPVLNNIAGVSERHAILVESIRAVLEGLPSRVTELVQLARASDWVALHERLLNQADKTDDVVAVLMTQVDADLTSARGRMEEDLRKAHERAVTTLIAAAVLSLVVAAILGATVTRSITQPLSLLNSGAKALAKGEFSHRVPVGGSDELAQLAQAFNSSAAELARLFEEARSERAKAESAHEALQEHARELARVNVDLQQFAYSASHDLQEPMRTVALYSQLLDRTYAASLDERAGEYIGYIVRAAMQMSRLLSDLLAYTRTSTVGKCGEEVTDANVVLCRVLGILEAQITREACTIHAEQLPKVAVRKVHMQQLLQNLLGNALKYRSERDPEISISATRQEDRWLFAIQDNGIGISPRYSKQIFGIFKRLHGHKYEGTGIGLAICQRIVELYGGEIWVDSDVGKGATFLFTLPAVRANSPVG